MILYNAEEHKYFHPKTKKEIAGVSFLMQKYGVSPTFGGHTNHLAVRGSKVHSITENWDNDTLDISVVEPELLAYLIQWKKFIKEEKVKILENEIKVWGEKYCYGGTLDRIVEIKSKVYVLDIKTGNRYKFHPVQLAFYQKAYENVAKTTKEYYTDYPIAGRICLYLNTTEYTPIIHTEQSDFNVVDAILTLEQWRKRKTAK